MTVRVSIEHHTEYRFDRPVELGPHEVRLAPAPHAATPVEAYALTVSPDEHSLHWQQDPFANEVARVTFPKERRTETLNLTVALIADLTPANPFDFLLAPDAERWPPRYDAHDRAALAPFLADASDPGQADPVLARRLAQVPTDPAPTIDFLVALNAALCEEITYVTREEVGVQSSAQTLQLASGSCRDSAWLQVQLLRGLGVAARFTSGYLVQLAPEPGAPDTVDLHAWAEAFVPGAGWIGLDATSGLLAGEGHIPLASAADPAGAAPVSGSHSEGSSTLIHTMTVTRVDAVSEAEQPYDERRWEAILAAGDTVDATLERQDVRLTMGGEPTFVAREQMERPEWQVAALGGDKHALAIALAGGLAADFAPDPLLMHTQGKWYPGEPLPRWQIGVYWRTDSRPLWPAPELLDDPAAAGDFTDQQAVALAQALAAALGFDAAQTLSPAREPDGAAADDAGLVLPLHRDAGDAHWSSPAWQVPADGIELLAGDGPIGARLPLAQLTAVADGEDPVPPTALCVSERDGHLHIYLPPLIEFAHAAELLDVLQQVACAQRVRIVLEGYGPPSDPRLGHFVITPDPGVIEINIHPSDGWRELVHRTEVIAREAHTLGLVAEKFDRSGRHLGTGGGSHLTLGGTSPADSPLLRRPALLRSMLTYWQHHPALSYLFSGQFVGPTSQAPRIDEARHESLYELEIAFDELDRLSALGSPPPAQVDSLLRNLLCDLTGNTHRAEFCIDKLYNPQLPSGRLGVLELRGFEMPPHPQMSLVQALLVRALVARLWADPYRGRLIRWGNRLHDDYLLPWFLERDLALVLDDLRDHGLALADEWFTPFIDFRMPQLGAVVRDGVRLELREAIEPWNVLGEQAASGATARFVDSSMQRLQLTVEGYLEGRHAVLCNGCTVPLFETGTAGTAVAGIRFRASDPPSALHPTIGVQGPVSLELVDMLSGRSLGGCRHHVANRDGSEHDELPADAAEARARRAARFEATDPSPGRIDVPPARRSVDYPRTLDLRAAGYRRVPDRP